MKEIGEIPPTTSQRTLERELWDKPDLRLVVKQYLAGEECSCTDSVDEQIWTGPTSSHTTRPFVACLTCQIERLLYPIPPRRL